MIAFFRIFFGFSSGLLSYDSKVDIQQCYMHTAYITHPLCLKHDMGAGHPERPARMLAIEDELLASGLYDYLKHYESPVATQEQLLRAHAESYVNAIKLNVPQHGLVQLDGDTAMNPFSYEAALRAAGPWSWAWTW